MGTKHTILLFMILFSCIVQVYRGLSGTRRTYGTSDVVAVLVEGPAMLWLLVTG